MNQFKPTCESASRRYNPKCEKKDNRKGRLPLSHINLLNLYQTKKYNKGAIFKLKSQHKLDGQC